MTLKQKLELERSRLRERLGALAAKGAEMSAEEREEMTKAELRLAESEAELRAATLAEENDPRQSATNEERTAADASDLSPETRKRLELRARCSVGAFLRAALGLHGLSGADAEYATEYRVARGVVPVDLFENGRREQASATAEHRVATGAPSTVGINMTPVVPAVFARSIASMIGVAIQRVESGTYSVPRLTTDLTAQTRAKGADVAATAAGFTVSSATPSRISARLELRAEDLAEAGVPAFESSLRENLGMVLSALLDAQILNGNNTAPNLNGILRQLSPPSNPTAVVTYASFAETMAALVDGIWAGTTRDIALVVNTTTYAKLASVFQTNTASAATDWAALNLAGLRAHSRMPAVSNTINECLAVRLGSAMMEPAGQASMPAVVPMWGDISIQDPYSAAASATESFTMHLLVGDPILRQPDAYQEVKIKTS